MEMAALATRTMSRGSTLILVILAVAALGVLADAAWAGTIVLKGTHSPDQILKACDDAGGQFSKTVGGTGEYGCKTKKGEVNCGAEGKCAGSCDKCGTRETSGGITDVLQPLGGKAQLKSTPATDPKGKAGVGKGDVKQPGSGNQPASSR
jgi:hypothetical protein